MPVRADGRQGDDECGKPGGSDRCPVVEMSDIESTGDFGFVHMVREPVPFGSCHFTFYKDPRDIPQEFHDRIGKKKPAGRERPTKTGGDASPGCI